MVSKDMLSQINSAYSLLEARMAVVFSSLNRRMFVLEWGWYNNHYSLGEDGRWIREAFPIPVISVKGLCDVEISFTGITLTTKLSRERALEYSFDKLADYDFEAYGVEDYLSNFYSKGNTIGELKQNIENSTEKEIFFGFTVPQDMNGDKMYNFAKLLKRDGFYY